MTHDTPSPSPMPAPRPSGPVRALIFDLGRVVFRFSYAEALASWSRITGLSIDEMAGRFVWDDTCQQYERGEIGGETFRQSVVRQLGRDIPAEAFFPGWTGIFRDEVPGITDLLTRLRGRYRLVALSNTNADHAPVWRKLYPQPLACFERVFASHEIGTRKPEPQAYQIALDHLGTAPTETVFVDDVAENTAAARQLGLQAVQFQDTPQLTEELRRLGVVL